MTSTDARRPAALPYSLRLAIGGALIALMSLNAQAEDGKTAPPSPDILLGPLFNDVQSAKLFADQKTFADAIPNSDPLMILADYRMQKPGQLRPAPLRRTELHAAERERHLCAAQRANSASTYRWPVAGPDPQHRRGGKMGLCCCRCLSPTWCPEDVSAKSITGTAISRCWVLPKAVTGIKSRIWSPTSPQKLTPGAISPTATAPIISAVRSPFFSFMVSLLATHDGDQVLKTYQPQLEKEYRYWMAGADALAPGSADKRAVRMADGALLNRYWDDSDTPRPESWLDDVKTAKSNPNRPATEIYRDLRSAAASGWDFSSRWMDNPQQLATIRTTSIVPVDLNALMFHLEKTLARASKASGDSAGATQYDALANARQQAIEKYLWNDKEGWYADYDLKSHKVRNQLTAAALFPLYVNAASRERATKVAAAAESRLLKPGGLTTTTVNSGQQWDAPNGWAPLQWVAVEGLQNYGQQKIAMEVTWRFLTNVQHTYDSKQKLVEKYDVSSTGTGGGGGEYPLQDGFGWTNGVTLKMLDLICPQEKPCDALPATRPATTPSPQDKPVAAPAANDPAPAEPQKTGS